MLRITHRRMVPAREAKWTKRMSRYVKLNFDASFYMENCVGSTDTIIRDYEGKCHASFDQVKAWAPPVWQKMRTTSDGRHFNRQRDFPHFNRQRDYEGKCHLLLVSMSIEMTLSIIINLPHFKR
jgi:hypothetical protein